MDQIEIFIALLFIIVTLAVVTRCSSIPYPIIFTIAGVLLGFVPYLPNVAIAPHLVFLLFLPPVLYFAAFFTSWRDFRANIRPISLLAFVLVALTTIAVGMVIQWLEPAIPAAVAYTLGAIVSPTDAIAATAIMRRFKVPRRIITIIEGESLLNDASALVLYKFAVAGVVIGGFSLADVTMHFFVDSAAGILFGLAVGWLLIHLTRRLDDSVISIAASLLIPFVTYVVAERLGISGVLAVVASGLLVGWYAPKTFSPARRLKGAAVWETFIFLINGFVFILIGLQLPKILSELGNWSYAELTILTLAIVATLIVMRFIWLLFAVYGLRALFPSIQKRDPRPPWQQVVIIGWVGMRGIVSLGAALALPLLLADGQIFPYRDLIIFLTFSSIVGMLIFQGLTLPLLIKWLGIKPDGLSLEEEKIARQAIGKAMSREVEELKVKQMISERAFSVANRECLLYATHRHDNEGPEIQDCVDELTIIRQQMITIGRNKLLELRYQGVISDEVMHIIQAEFDLDEMRLTMHRA